MKIHEYQAKSILAKFGVPIPRGKVAASPDEAKKIAQELGGLVVVKAQIHAGGRGKGGGVKLAKTPHEAFDRAKEIIGMNLVTHQTGPEGKKVLRVLIEEGMNIKHEYYLGMVIDRAKGLPVIMASTEGGVEIEKVAAESPDKIIKIWINPTVGLMPYQIKQITFGLGLNKEASKSMGSFMQKLYTAFLESDASLAEINPLILTDDDKMIALDAKMNFDDSALYRHPDIVEMRDLSEEDALEIEASKHDLNYIKLDGNVGCMVNGAGLAMATMDIILSAGAYPANFLDVGGGASAERVASAFKILMSDPKVKAVLINIFGGIVRCDRVAGGIIEALKQVQVNVPVVVRLAGTNAKEAAEMLDNSPMKFQVAKSLAEAAKLIGQAMK
jgi:succinyl-CoA synthetase beta subunit